MEHGNIGESGALYLESPSIRSGLCGTNHARHAGFLHAFIFACCRTFSFEPGHLEVAFRLGPPPSMAFLAEPTKRFTSYTHELHDMTVE